MLSNKRIDLLLHFMLWVPSIAIPMVIMPLKDGSQGYDFSFSKIVFIALQISVFYTMVYYLYPTYFLKKRISTYLFSIIGLCVLIGFLCAWTHHITAKNPSSNIWAAVAIKFLISMAVMATGTCYMLIAGVVKDQRLAQENLKSELVFLRSQVSPHFMFNTLNSMVSLARKKSDKLEPALIELSNLMHYMLYESDEEKVSITKEINYIQSYIDLQTLRFGHHVRILFLVQKPDDDLCIEPMLLVPLIENAFKHGVGLIHDPEITVNLDVQKDSLQLNVRNKYNKESTETKDKTSGIGLTNLDRRLKLLYPNKHTLAVARNGQYFNASLTINLHHDQVSCYRR